MTDRAAIYTRVSTEEQANPDKTSLASQDERCRAYCQAMEWEVVEVYQDPGISGTLEPALRPALSRLLADAAEGKFKRIVFLKIDRLARNLRKLLNLSHELDGSGVGLVSVEEQFDTSTASGRLYFNLLGAFAEFEAEQIKERMTGGRRAAVSQKGKYLSSKAPYGYARENGHISINKPEAKVVKQMYRLAMAGTGLKTIAEKLNKQGVPPPNANAKSEKRRAKWWWHTTVYKILTARKYIGESSYAGTPMPCPRIIEDETFYAVQRGLPRRKKDSPRNTRNFYLLQHLVYCRYCATHFPDETAHRYQARIVEARGKSRTAYICRRRQQYGKKAGHEGVRWTWSGDVLDTAIKRHLVQVLMKKDYLVQEARVYVEEAQRASREQDEKEESLATQLVKLQEQERKVLDGWERGVYQSEQQAQERLADVRAQQEETRTELERLRTEDRSQELTRAEKLWLLTREVVDEHAFPNFPHPKPRSKNWVDEAIADIDNRETLELVDDALFMYKEFDSEKEAVVPKAAATKVISVSADEWWRDRATRLIDKIWIEDDGRHLTVEGIIEVASGKVEVVPDDRRTR